MPMTDVVARARPRCPRGLYLVTPDEPDTARLLALLTKALAGRPALVQYRSKCMSGASLRAQAGAVVGVCRAAGVPCVVNDSVTLAREVRADGVHLGREDGDAATARRMLGPDGLVGVSCYDEWARAVTGQAQGADYVAFGAMFSSRIKPDAVHAPIELVMRARRELDCVVAVIGGITAERTPPLVAAGAGLIAVMSDVFDAPDPGARVAAYRALFQS
jgi:thiamine-phosphate pyrophosphorylase